MMTALLYLCMFVAVVIGRTTIKNDDSTDTSNLMEGAEDGSKLDWCSKTCEKEGTIYKHTMCLYKEGGSDSCNKDTRLGVTDEEKQVLVDLHNQLRATVASGKETKGTRGPQPPAADMPELRWDEELATVAQRWADQCDLSTSIFHDDCRIASDNVEVGQNIGWQGGHGTTVNRISLMKQLVNRWYDEVKDMDPGLVKEYRSVLLQATGHYTQLVWGATTRVGCGLAFKEQGRAYSIKLVCNYKEAGNFLSLPIYTVGKPASKCVEKSKDYPGLCKPK